MLVAALLLAGCADADPAPPVDQVAVSAEEYQALPRFSLSPALTLCDAVAGACDLGGETGAAPDLNGGTIVWEFSRLIRRYDSSGRHWANIGRRGQGPGEYGGVVAVNASSSGFRVVDVSNLRIANFDTAGVFTGFTNIRNIPQTTRQLGLMDGALVVFTIQPLNDGTGSAFRALRHDDRGGIDTLAVHTMPGYGSSQGPAFRMPGLFEATPVWSISAGQSVFFAAGKDYEVWEYRDRRPVRQLVVDHQPRPVEQAELERASGARLARAGPARAAVEDAIRRAATVHPSITQLFATGDGGMLVREAPDAADESVRWTRFNAAWKPVGYYLAPASARVLLVHQGQLLLQEELAAGVRLRWYRLE